MSKKVVAIVSVLKPVDDTRNYEKTALSLGNTNKYAINIIGFWSKKIPRHPNISFYPVFNFGRLSIRRLWAPVKVFQIILKVKPQLIIVTCAELLSVMILYRIIFGTKVIYDIQENYYRNVLYSGAYPMLASYPLAWSIRLIEKLSAPFVNYFFLAEKVYKQQLRFANSRSQVLENKAIIPDNLQHYSGRRDDKIIFVYTGTIAVHYGIFDAIDFIHKLKHIMPRVQLLIIGYAPDKKMRQKVIELARNKDYIKTEGVESLVSHTQIIKSLSEAHFCLMPYHDNKSIKGRIPTKLYECLSLETPLIISPNNAWNSLIEENNAGIIYNFHSEELPSAAQLKQKFYGRNLATNYLWKDEGEKLIRLAEKLLK